MTPHNPVSPIRLVKTLTLKPALRFADEILDATRTSYAKENSWLTPATNST
jgi:hypothetical protein